jgi:hypothetical protein
MSFSPPLFFISFLDVPLHKELKNTKMTFIGKITKISKKNAPTHLRGRPPPPPLFSAPLEGAREQPGHSVPANGTLMCAQGQAKFSRKYNARSPQISEPLAPWI